MSRVKRIPKFPPVKLDQIKFDGGLDVDTPPLSITAGYCRRAQNFELGVNGGYRRCAGYERFDGHTKPSDGAYAILNATITGSYAVGNTLTGATSGATGVIAAATATYFVITKITGTFQAAENLQISAVTIAVCGGAQTIDGAATSKLHAQYKNAAADIYRADIAAVPGSGSILGVVQFSGVVYAIRNNAGSTAAVIYKSSSSGWTAVTMFYELSFTAGSGSAPAEGATITQGAVSAVVKRVVLQSGTWDGGTAAGRFIVAAPSGGSFSAGAFTAGVTATCSGAEALITLTVGGKYEFVIENFGGATGTKRIYGCSTVQRGFEFDGTVYVPITTGMTTDTPSHLFVHKKHLFFSFGPSSQHSGPGKPYVWTVLSGAAELSVGDDITAFMSQPGSEASGGALVILSRNRISVLYGSSSSDWNLISYAEDQGAYAYSSQRIGMNGLMLDDRGLTNLATSANYGNFVGSSLSQRLESWVKDARARLAVSCVSRDASQWRIFFSDGYALYVTFNGNKLRGSMPMYFPNSATCIHSSELSDGSEAIYFGSTNGMVYQMEKGTSFDGEAIESFLYLVFNPSKNVRQRKRYKKAMFECAGDGYAEFNVTYELAYASTDVPQPGSESVIFNFTPANWDTAVFDQFIWDGQALTPSELDLNGTAENISLILQSNGDYFSPATFSGAILHFIPRRALR